MGEKTNHQEGNEEQLQIIEEQLQISGEWCRVSFLPDGYNRIESRRLFPLLILYSFLCIQEGIEGRSILVGKNFIGSNEDELHQPPSHSLTSIRGILMFLKVFRRVSDLYLNVRSDGTLLEPIPNQHRERIGCVLKVWLPLMEKCEGDTIDVEVDEFKTLLPKSRLRYNFEFPINTGGEKRVAVSSLEHEQCVVIGVNPSQRVTITSRGEPVDMKGDMSIRMTVFHDYSVGGDMDEILRGVRSEMRERRDIMMRTERDEISRETRRRTFPKKK